MSNQKFKDLNEMKIYDEIINNIKIGSHDSIDWYNLHTEVEMLLEQYKLKKGHDLDIVVPFVKYFFEKRFKERNKLKYSVDTICDDINIVLDSVFLQILHSDFDKISRDTLINSDYSIPSGTKNQVDKSLKYFELFNVIKKSKIEGNTYFKVDMDNWFKQSKYELRDISLINELVPVITAFIRNGNIGTYNIEELFKRISEVIEFAIRPSVEHNFRMEIEESILITIEENKSYDSDLSKQTINVIDNDNKLITILPVKIIYKSNEKYVVCTNIENDEILELPLYEIILEDTDIYTADDMNIKSEYTSLDIKVEKTQKKKEKIEVFLEIDSQVIDYYKIKPLSNTTLYFTEDEKKEFLFNYEALNANPNKFFVKAVESEDMIISTLMHTLDHVKVLSPKDLNDKIANKLKGFLEKSDYSFEDIVKSSKDSKEKVFDKENEELNNEVSEESDNNNLPTEEEKKSRKRLDLNKKPNPLDL